MDHDGFGTRAGRAAAPAMCRDHWRRGGVVRSHQSIASVPAVMRARTAAMNAACVPPPREKQNFHSSPAAR